MAREGGESTWRWLIGVLLAVTAIVATLVAADKIRLPGLSDPQSPAVVDTFPKLVLSPNSGKPGTTVKISISGFGPEEVVTVRFAEVTLAWLTTNKQGKAEETHGLIPSDANGATTVTARGGLSGRTATAIFQVLA